MNDMSFFRLFFKRYKTHYLIGFLVFISFVLTGFKFDIVQADKFAISLYSFFQVIGLVTLLCLSKEFFFKIKRFKESLVLLIVTTILMGSVLSVFFDIGLRFILDVVFSNIIFKEKSVDGYFNIFFEGLKYPMIFWPLCELIDNYLNKLTKIIYLDKRSGQDLMSEISFLKSVSKQERKDLLAIEAQQNYIRLIFPSNSYTILYRLKNAVNELPHQMGMQVHRSYWVRFDKQAKLVKGPNLKLANDELIPVSRSYAREVKNRF